MALLDRKEYAELKHMTVDELKMEKDRLELLLIREGSRKEYIGRLIEEARTPYGPEPAQDVVIVFQVWLGGTYSHRKRQYRFAAISYQEYGSYRWNITGRGTTNAPRDCTWKVLTDWIAANQGSDLLLYSTAYETHDIHAPLITMSTAVGRRVRNHT